MFNLSLVAPPASLPAESERPEVTGGDFQTMVMEVCETLDDAGYRFRMGGFGQDDWRLDVSYDMSAVIEQLPDVLAALQNDGQAEIDLYSQGIERTVVLTPEGDGIKLRCQSSTSWIPNPPVEELPKKYVVGELKNLATDFAKAVSIVQPELMEVEPLRQWRAGNF